MIKFYPGQLLTSLLPLSGTQSALKDILKACLSDGFGIKTPSAVVIASGVATFTVSGGHLFYEKAVAAITGVTVTGGTLNGERRVLSKSTNTISVDATGIADQTASLSTPTIKVAPLGWTELFPGTAGKFAARSAQMDSTRMCIRLDDTGAVYSPRIAHVRGFENMTDIDTGTGPFPTVAQSSTDGFYWYKSTAADTSTRAWTLVGDEYGFYISMGAQQGPTSGFYRACFFFGDLKAIQSGDPYACVLTGNFDNDVASGSAPRGNLNLSQGGSAGGASRVVARRFSGVGGPAEVTHITLGRMFYDTGDAVSGSDVYTNKYPANPGNLLLIAPVAAPEVSNTYNLRGLYPGLYHILQDLAGGFASDSFIPGSGVYAGRDFLAVVGGTLNGSKTGSILFDLTGPWR